MTLRNFDDTFQHKLFGYKSTDDYWQRASCMYSVPSIRTPTLFINALDDPIIGSETIQYDVISKNPYTAIATTKHGGHLGYHESLLPQANIWLFTPVLTYFNSINEIK